MSDFSRGYLSVFKRLFSRNRGLLTPAPSSRLKHYASESGHYYEYSHEGHRSYRSPTDSGTEFVFRVLMKHKSGSVAVFLSAGVLGAWEQNHGREFSAAERYAIAKMAHFQAFDECPVRAKMVDAVRVSAADLNAIVAKLNIE